MPRSTPVGWLGLKPATGDAEVRSPRPVGWQGFPSLGIERISVPAPEDVDPVVDSVSRGDVEAADVVSESDVSRETPMQGAEAPAAETTSGEVVEDDRASVSRETSAGRSGAVGYDLLLGSRRPEDVSRETREDGLPETLTATDRETSRSNDLVEVAEPDDGAVGDAATTITEILVPAGEHDGVVTAPAPTPSVSEPTSELNSAPHSASGQVQEATEDAAVVLEAQAVGRETVGPETTNVDERDSGEAGDEDAHRAEGFQDDDDTPAYRPRHYADEMPARAPLSVDDDEPVKAAVSPAPLVAGSIPPPSRKARRAVRPRVPSFDRVTDENWRHADEGDEPLETPTHRVEAEAPETKMALTSVERLPRPSHPRVLTVANQKGGVGKTTTTVNVAAGLAQAGLKVLVIDIDPQGNASTALGIEHHAEVPSVYDVIVDGKALADVVQECPDIPGLWCAPATIDLAGAEIELVSLVARESRLHRAINAELDAEAPDDRFDYVFIDCPPSLGLLTVNAFVAADEVFIPIQCEYYALEGLSQLLKNIEMIKMHLNPGLHVSTILLTMYDGRTNLSAQVADEVRAHFPEQVLGALVPRSVRISEAPSHGETVMTYDPSSTGALSYRDAAHELALRGADVPPPAGRIGR